MATLHMAGRLRTNQGARHSSDRPTLYASGQRRTKRWLRTIGGSGPSVASANREAPAYSLALDYRCLPRIAGPNHGRRTIGKTGTNTGNARAVPMGGRNVRAALGTPQLPQSCLMSSIS